MTQSGQDTAKSKFQIRSIVEVYESEGKQQQQQPEMDISFKSATNVEETIATQIINEPILKGKNNRKKSVHINVHSIQQYTHIRYFTLNLSIHAIALTLSCIICIIKCVALIYFQPKIIFFVGKKTTFLVYYWLIQCHFGCTVSCLFFF